MIGDKVKKALVGISALAIFASAAGPAFAASADVTSGHIGASKLGELIVLDGLFDASGSNGVATNGSRIGASRLGELIVLDGLFDNKNADGTTGGKRVSKLGELIVLDDLFANGSTNSDGTGRHVSRLGELIVLDNLFAR